ncbi:hypothetical protein PENANT_c186G08475 [Penicillium antarcticum]|uniref:Uncharacterized protein n=1 Tax=Penicillium antarcticum TaxID=416450 RepID=A0A1V6PB35_9EURO|nr:hypothetical protein PENANT_c186G08475 [Penicillium antarcticum]
MCWKCWFNRRPDFMQNVVCGCGLSDPLAIRYVAKFMHQTGLLAQFQHTQQEESDDETGDPTKVMEQSPEDARYSPPLAPTFEDGENLTQLFKYTLPDCTQAHARPDAR